jgi:Nucleotide-diphospho-sugar transferase
MPSSSSQIFPLPFNSVRQISGGREGRYVVGAMFTASHAEKAERLAASCERFGLQYAIHEVQVIHRSIYILGADDLAYTKANFIHHLLVTHGKPVLYLDADCEFVAEPELISELVRSDCDFAIYNWLADEYTDAFIPIELGVGPDGPPLKNRFFRYCRSVNWFTTSQLICSGCVQFYRNLELARQLLSEWYRTIAMFPGTADDSCLNFAFNNRAPPLSALNVRWLPKAYARISWWIYEKPVINHEEIPQIGAKLKFRNFDDIDTGERRIWYPSAAELKSITGPLPRDCIIDAERGVFGKIVGDQLVTIGITDQTFWI